MNITLILFCDYITLIVCGEECKTTLHNISRSVSSTLPFLLPSAVFCNTNHVKIISLISKQASSVKIRSVLYLFVEELLETPHCCVKGRTMSTVGTTDSVRFSNLIPFANFHWPSRSLIDTNTYYGIPITAY
jgi:hypothetical protein